VYVSVLPNSTRVGPEMTDSGSLGHDVCSVKKVRNADFESLLSPIVSATTSTMYVPVSSASMVSVEARTSRATEVFGEVTRHNTS